MDDGTATALDWLLESDEPSIRAMTRRDLLDEDPGGEDVLAGPIVQTLLAGQEADGGFGSHPYRKWTGAHWRLISLVELEIPAGETQALRAAETVLAWLTSSRHRNSIHTLDGLVRRCASQEGNALAVSCRLGLADDPRVVLLAESLVEWQWPDGGWNCDVRANGHRSSFHESHPPAWGLFEYWRATKDPDAKKAAERTAELFLEHRLFRSLRTREPIRSSWLALHYPPYWHYDILQGLLIMWRMGLAGDPRCSDALDVLEKRRLADGRWRPGGYWWQPPGSTRAPEVVDWGRSRPNEMITLNALRVLRAANRLDGL